MSAINLKIPVSLQSRIEEITSRENMEQFIATALVE
jgi:hypothetical protein